MKWFSYSEPFVRFFGEVACFDTADALLAEIGDVTGLEFFLTNLNGGSANNALRIFDTLKGRVKCATISKACVSAGVILAMTADRIVMTRDAKLLIHPPTICVDGGRNRLRMELERLDELTERLAQIVSERRGIKRKATLAWYSSGENLFTAEQALIAGLVDEIIEPPPERATNPFPEFSGPSDDGKGAILIELLTALGTIQTSDPERLRRELYAWQFHNIKEAL